MWSDAWRESNGLPRAAANPAKFRETGCRRTIAARQRKLHARIQVAVGRDVAGGVARAAGQALANTFVHRGRRGAESFDVAHEIGIVEEAGKFARVHAMAQHGRVAVHHRRYRGIEFVNGAQFAAPPRGRLRYRRDSCASARWPSSLSGRCDRSKRMAASVRSSEPGTFVMASCTSGRWE